MKFDFVDIILGSCVLILVGGLLFGKATWEQVITMSGMFLLKKIPATIGK